MPDLLTQNINFVNSRYTYTIYIDGTTVKARNNITGVIDYSGDATDDCSPTINNALANIENITSLSPATDWGGGINLLHGHYVCKTTISLDVDDVGLHGATIVGEGWGTFLDFDPPSTLARGILTQMAKPVLRDFRIKGNSDVTTLIEVQGHGSAGTLPRNNSATIEGILLEGPNANADFRTGETFEPVTGQIGIWFNPFVGAANQLMFYHHVNNCKFLSLDYAMRSTGANATSVFANGVVGHNNTYFWYLENSAGSSTLANAYIEGSAYSRYGVYVNSDAGASLLLSNVWGELGITPGQECALVKIESGASNSNFFGSSIKNIIADPDDSFYTVKDDNTTQLGMYPGNYAVNDVKAFHVDTATQTLIGDCKHSIQVAAESPLEVYRDTNTANNYAGIRFGGKDSASAYVPYGFVLSKIITNTAGAVDGEMTIWTKQAGTSRECLTVTKDGILKCGGINRRVIFDETGLTAGRTFTFPDDTTQLAGLETAQTFTAAQTVNALLDIQQDFRLSGDISPTALSADVNDYNPTGLSTASVIRLDSDSSFRTITGLAGGADGRILTLHNISSANTILLANQNTASSAGNRFDFGGYDIPLFPSSQIQLQYDSTSTKWRLISNGGNFVIPSAKQGLYNMGHFVAATNEGQMTSTAASGGTQAVITTVAGHNGVVEYSTGTSASGTGSMRTGNSLNLLGNNWYMRFDMVLKQAIISDATDNYTLRIGFIDSGTAEPTDGCYFRYNHAVNSGNWQKVARNNGTETGSANDTTVAADTNWHRFTVIVNPAGNKTEYFIDGVSRGTETTNIPTGAGRVLGWGMAFVKTAGTGDKAMIDVDSVEVVGYSNVVL